MSEPQVSVIMPAHNGEQWIREALESVTAQTYQNLQIIVADNKSTDGTLTAVEKYKKTDPRLIILSEPEKGVSRARNRGLLGKEATGDYFALMDCDDLWQPEKIATQISVLQKHPPEKLLLCGTGATIIYPNPGGNRADGRCEIMRCPNPTEDGKLDWSVTYPSSWTFSRHTLMSVGAFNPKFAASEDNDWMFRLLRQGGELVYAPEPLITYYAPEPGKIYGDGRRPTAVVEEHTGWLLERNGRWYLENYGDGLFGHPSEWLIKNHGASLLNNHSSWLLENYGTLFEKDHPDFYDELLRKEVEHAMPPPRTSATDIAIIGNKPHPKLGRD